MKDKIKSNKKKLPIGITLLLILLGSTAFVFYCVGTGCLIDAIIAFIIGDVEQSQMTQYIFTVAFMGLLHLFFLISLILGRMPFVKKKEGKSYREDIIGVFAVVMVLSAVMLIALSDKTDRNIDFVVGAIMFPASGFIVSPIIFKRVLKALNNWQSIFYDKGNLQNCKNDKDFHIVENPVSFEKKLYRAVIRQQLIGFIGVIAVMIVVTALTIYWIAFGYDYRPENILVALFYVGLRRATGRMFFLTVFIVAFSPAILSYCLTNSIYRVMLIKKHKYIAFHAIVRKVDDGRISLKSDKYHYDYKYTTCVGILEKNVHDTPATLIFVPDNVLVFPDSKFNSG